MLDLSLTVKLRSVKSLSRDDRVNALAFASLRLSIHPRQISLTLGVSPIGAIAPYGAYPRFHPIGESILYTRLSSFGVDSEASLSEEGFQIYEPKEYIRRNVSKRPTPSKQSVRRARIDRRSSKVHSQAGNERSEVLPD